MPIKKSQTGFTIMQVAVAIAVFAIASLVMINLFDPLWKANRAAALSTTTKQLQLLAMGNLGNYESWQQIIRKNNGTNTTPNMTCALGTVGTCVSNTLGTIDLVTALGSLEISHIPGEGFAIDGSRCSTYVEAPAVGNDSCPLRVEVIWKPLCGTAVTCNKPLNTVRVNFKYNPQNPIKMPPLNVFNIDVPAGADTTLFVPRGSLSSDAYIIDCGMDGKKYAGGNVTPPSTTMFVMPAGTFYTDVRGCLQIEAYLRGPGM